jgi:hypothetical protein
VAEYSVVYGDERISFSVRFVPRPRKRISFT